MPDNYSVKYVFEAIDNMSKSIREISNQAKDLEKQMENSGKSSSNFSKKMENAGKSLKDLGSKTKWLSAAIIGEGVLATETYARFEKGLFQVNKQLSKEDIAKYGKELEKLQEEAVQTGFSIDDASKALTLNTNRLGVNEEAIQAYREALKLSEVGNVDLISSVDGIQRIMNQFNVKDAKDVANSLFLTGKNKVSLDEMLGSLERISPIANLAGMNFKEMLSIFSVMAGKLGSAGQATTAFESIFKAVVSAKAGSLPAEAMKRMGISFGLANVKAVGFTKVLQQVRNAANKFGEDAIGLAIPGIKGMRGILSLTDDSMVNMSKSMKEMSENTLSLGDSFSQSEKLTSEAIESIAGNFKLLNKDIGSDLAPIINYAAEKFGILVKWFRELDPSVRQTMVVIGGLIAVITPLAVGLGSILAVISLISLPMIGIGLAIVGVGAAVAAAIVYWDDLKKSLMSVWDWITKVWDKMTSLFKLSTWTDTIKQSMAELTGSENSMLLEQMNRIESNANVNVNLNAPKGSIRSYEKETTGGMNLGVNMATSGSW